MALRLIEMVLPEADGEKVRELLKEREMVEHRQIHLPDGKVLVRILLESNQSEAVLDLLDQQYAGWHNNRLVMIPVQATLPRNQSLMSSAPGRKLRKAIIPERISIEELYENIKDAAHCSRVYLSMAIMSTIVATVGLLRDSAAIIIGAMVIAPLLGPNMALALGATLGDLSLLRRAILTTLAGVAVSLVLSVIFGAFMHLDPNLEAIISRTHVGLGDIAVALASGCAGALAFTTGVSAVMIGVMVAVALLPPLVVFGLLLGNGLLELALGALLLFFVNLICINLAGMITFLIQGIHPAIFWEKGHIIKAKRVAITLWILLLAALILLSMLLPKGFIY